MAQGTNRLPLPPGVEERSLTTPRGQRYFLEYAPRDLKPGAPLVILLHGGTQSMRKIFREGRMGTRRWLDLATRDRFVLVAPNGVNPKTGDTYGDNQSWNDLRPDGPGRPSHADDVGFVLALIDRMARDRGIDRRRVYVTGASNGGMMTYRLLVEQPQAFASGAAFLANLPATAIPQAALPTPLLIANGTADPLVRYQGGLVSRNRGSLRSTDDTVAYWSRVNEAEGKPRQTRTLPDLDPSDGCRLYETRYANSQGKVMVALLRMEGGGHYIPSLSAPTPSRIVRRLLGSHPCRDVEGADIAWQFMRQYQRP